jgi:hypothetical protein
MGITRETFSYACSILILTALWNDRRICILLFGAVQLFAEIHIHSSVTQMSLCESNGKLKKPCWRILHEIAVARRWSIFVILNSCRCESRVSHDAAEERRRIPDDTSFDRLLLLLHLDCPDAKSFRSQREPPCESTFVSSRWITLRRSQTVTTTVKHFVASTGCKLTTITCHWRQFVTLFSRGRLISLHGVSIASEQGEIP